MTNDESPRLGDAQGDRLSRLGRLLFVIRHHPLRRVPAFVILILLALTGCGGAFMTSTPTYARLNSAMVFKEFKAKNLRVDAVQELAKDALGAMPPRYTEAKGFRCGGGTATATLFTFDSPSDLAAMADYIKKKYDTRHRQMAYENVLLVFWLPSNDDTLGYDSVLLALR